jgi:hypothetical protein
MPGNMTSFAELLQMNLFGKADVYSDTAGTAGGFLTDQPFFCLSVVHPGCF